MVRGDRLRRSRVTKKVESDCGRHADSQTVLLPHVPFSNQQTH